MSPVAGWIVFGLGLGIVAASVFWAYNVMGG